MEATVTKEYTINGGRHVKEMSDGRILVSSPPRFPGTNYGIYTDIKGEVTDEKIAKAKEQVVEEVCRIIREIANERDDFFFIKPLPGEVTSVGHKFLLPTVEEDGFARFKDLPPVE